MALSDDIEFIAGSKRPVTFAMMKAGVLPDDLRLLAVATGGTVSWGQIRDGLVPDSTQLVVTRGGDPVTVGGIRAELPGPVPGTLSITIDDENTPIIVTFVFSAEPVGFTLDDVTVNDATLSNLTPGDGNLTWTAELTPDALFEGDITVSVDTWEDAQGVEGLGDSATITVEAELPATPGTLVITIDGEATPILVTLVFSAEPVGFVVGDIDVNNATLSNLTQGEDDVTWTVELEPEALYEGDITVSVEDDAWEDSEGVKGKGDSATITVGG